MKLKPMCHETNHIILFTVNFSIYVIKCLANQLLSYRKKVCVNTEDYPYSQLGDTFQPFMINKVTGMIHQGQQKQLVKHKPNKYKMK